jgi:hypothetical protein
VTTASDSLGSVRAYLRRRGWVEEPPGPGGSWWHRPDHQPSGEAVIGVPARIVPGTTEWRSVVDHLATYEQRSFEEIAETIRSQFIDVTQLSIDSDFVTLTVPLSAGATLLASARMMLRSAAMAAVHPRADIVNFSPVTDGIANEARLAHTREGAYIVPLHMPLPPPQDDLARESLVGMETERVEYEPAERRVTRTLAQALGAVQQRIVEPAREPQLRDIPALVAAGVSRQFVGAIKSVLADQAVSEFNAVFQWAGAITPPGGVLARVELPEEAEPLLAMAEDLLKSSRRDPEEIVTGQIVEVRQLPGAPSGEIAIQTMRGRRMSEVRVQLSAHELDEAHEWMRQRRAVVVAGQLLRERGRPLRILEPSNMHPLDETFLF